MRKKIVNVVALSMVVSCLCGTVASAAELYAMPNENSSTNRCVDAGVEEVFSEEEMLELCPALESGIALAAATVTPDDYESNNTRETAYPYAKTEKMTGKEFYEGYATSNCHVEGDEDFFSITMSPLYTYDVVLKNLYGQDRHIYIWENNGDGTWSRWRYKYQEEGEPEHWRFTPESGGTYYIQIAGGGVESFHYFFAVEKKGKINTDLWPTSSNMQ